MAVLIGNDPYTRWVIDPEEGETKFRVKGEIVSVEDLQATLEALPEDERGDAIEEIVLLPKPDARRISVTYRPLRALDDFAMKDMMTDSGVPAGSGERLLLKRAVLRWDWDVPWTEAIIDQLNPGIVQQLRRWVSWGIAPPEQDPETGLSIDPPTKEETTTTPEPQVATEETAIEEDSSSPKTKTSPESISAGLSEDDSTA